MILDAMEVHLDNHALNTHVEGIKALYKELKVGIIDLAFVQMQVDMNKKQIIKIHKKTFNCWQGKNGSWYTYLPCETIKPPKGRLIKRVSEEKLLKSIVDYYVEEEQANELATSSTFDKIYKEWRELKNLELGDNSVLKYDGDYKRYFESTEFAETPVGKISENTIRKFMLETIKKHNLCREATGRLFSYIKNTIRYARIEKLIVENPVEFLELKEFTKHCVENEKKPEEQYYSDVELILIKKGLGELYDKTPTFMPRYALELALLTGMRAGELAPLMWSDIGTDYISIDKSEKYNRRKGIFYIDKTKTKKSRQFPICDEITTLFDRIREVQEEHGTMCDYIFSDGNMGHINTPHISDCMKRLTRTLEIHGGGVTALRKTINSNLRRSGVPVTIVASILGHTTEVNEKYYTYDTSNLEEKKEIVKQRNAKIMALASA